MGGKDAQAVAVHLLHRLNEPEFSPSFKVYSTHKFIWGTKSVVRVKNILGDDVYGQWHIEKILVQKDGQRYAIIPDRKSFSTKDEAEYHANISTQRFVERKLRNNSPVRWRAVLKFLFTAAFISVMTAVAVQWWEDQPIGRLQG